MIYLYQNIAVGVLTFMMMHKSKKMDDVSGYAFLIVYLIGLYMFRVFNGGVA